MLLASCSMKGRFLEASLLRTERELAGPGRPGSVDTLVAKVERREAQRLALGARGCLAARGGYVIPASKGCLTQHPWRLPPLHPLAPFSRGTAKPRTLSRRENADVWLFGSWIRKLRKTRKH